MVENYLALSLRDILEIENSEEILNFRCPDTGYLLWPLIRNVFTRFIASDMLYETPLISEERAPRPWSAYVCVLKSCTRNLLKRKTLKGPILISASGSHILRDGRYFNRLSDHFALAAHGKTVTMEDLFTDWHWPFPRHNERVIFSAPLLAIPLLYEKFAVRAKHWEIAGALVEFVARRARKLFDWPLSERRRFFFATLLARRAASLPLNRWLYTRLFQQTAARVLIKEEGCYGNSSVINAVARECGVVTAEYQHGVVSAGHDAYNFAPILCASSEYKRVLPEYFLAYGRWWINQINAPIVKLPIGNPDRTELPKSVRRRNGEKTDLIVLGDGVETEKYLALSTLLVKELGAKHRVVFRPHPMERGHMLQLSGGKASDVIIEWDKGIYEAFETAEIVVSELSTGLFEAVGLVDRIFRWDTPKAVFYSPAHPFAVFSDADDLVAKIRDGESGRVDTLTVEDLWAPNWKENYLAFLESVCPGIVDCSVP